VAFAFAGFFAAAPFELASAFEAAGFDTVFGLAAAAVLAAGLRTVGFVVVARALTTLPKDFSAAS
jgi:uncharacterized membrane protein